MGEQLRSKPFYFSPKSLSDALDSTEEFPGAMASLQNLIADPSTKNLFQCRPASVPLLLPKWPNPIFSFGFVSVAKIVGDILYGMVASRLNSGFDQPFAFDLIANQVIPVGGITPNNVPASPPTSGAWTPPTMDLIGRSLVVTHPGFSAGPFATATGSITFTANPSNGDNILLGSVSYPVNRVEFVTATPTPGDNQVQIGATLAATLANLVAALPTFGPDISQATYTTDGVAKLNIAYSVPGASGNNFALGASAPTAVISGPALTGGTGCYFGYFDVGVPGAVAWGAGNTWVTPLPVVPTAVIQFNGRANFIVPNTLPGLYATDELDPLTMTNPTYILTFDDTQTLTALGALPLNNQLGGIIQSVIVFKGISNIYQVTGDPALNNWAKNTLNVATGTFAPRSIVSTPKGLMFLSPQGMRLITFDAQVTDPIGVNGTGVTMPFMNVPVPSRVAAASNASIVRVSLTAANGLQWEFWLDVASQTWTGPHTLPATWMQAYKNTFIFSPLPVPNTIYQSDWLQNANSVYTEVGTPMRWAYQTSMLPNPRDMKEHSMTETSILFSSSTGATAYCLDEAGNVITDSNGNNPATAKLPAGGATANWSGDPCEESSIWYGQAFAVQPAQIPWTDGTVFGRLSLQLKGLSDSVTRIGAATLRYEELGIIPQAGN